MNFKIYQHRLKRIIVNGYLKDILENQNSVSETNPRAKKDRHIKQAVTFILVSWFALLFYISENSFQFHISQYKIYD